MGAEDARQGAVRQLQLSVGQYVRRQVRAVRYSASDEGRQIAVNLLRDYEPTIGGDPGVLQDDVRGVVGRQLHQSQVLFGHKRLLYAAVTPGVERVLARVESHLA